MRYYIATLLISLFQLTVLSQTYRNPFDFPILLSGNFGELRSNHFHAGIDFKTQGVEGKPIHAVADGYVSRISVGAFGYGNGIYLTHPDGTMTVYGHLQKFNDSITAYVKEQQYLQESFSVNLLPEANRFPIKKGDIIGLAGNSGSSAGPHLHFEVRDIEKDELIDPLEYYKEQITDTRPPKIDGIMVYAFEGKGVVNGKNGKFELKPVTAKTGKQVLTGKLEAWGEIGLAVKAYDYMNNTTNIYGVKKISLSVDSQIVYQSYLDRFGLSESRYLNSYVDYEEWRSKRSFYMKSFVDPGNKLRFTESINRGIITIDKEKMYHLVYHLEDAFGNSTQLSVWIDGKEQEIPAPKTEGTELFHWRSENRFGSRGIRLTIPAGNLYDNIYFRYTVKEDSTATAATHFLHNKPVALHESAQLSIRLQNDTLENKNQYGIVRIQNGRASWIGGEYRQGWIDTNIRELGTYSIRIDNMAPVITPVEQEKWLSSQTVTFRITDNLSGIKNYRGEMNGEYVLFEFDGKKSLISYKLDSERLQKGSQTLKLTATDACGNTSEYTYSFIW